MAAKDYKKCPKCGSKNYDRSRTEDVTYRHYARQPVQRLTSSDYFWNFECRECGYVETDY